MTRKYETMFIMKPTLNEEEAKARIEFVKETIEKGGCEIVAIDEMGTRQLAYPIEKFERGNYVVIYFEGKPASIPELERIYRITEDIIRFIVIKYERKVELAAWERMVNKAKGLPVEEKKLSEAPRRAPRGGRFDRDRGDRGDRRGPRGDRNEGGRPNYRDNKEAKPAEAAAAPAKEEPKDA